MSLEKIPFIPSTFLKYAHPEVKQYIGALHEVLRDVAVRAKAGRIHAMLNYKELESDFAVIESIAERATPETEPKMERPK